MITILNETNKKINELSYEELKNIQWDSVMAEDLAGIDADTYRRLTSTARFYVSRLVNNYNEKPVEYWNEVFKYSPKYVGFVSALVRNTKEPLKMFNAHKEYFLENMEPALRVKLGVITFSKFIKLCDNSFDCLCCSNDVFLSPHTPVSFFTKVLKVKGKEKTALRIIREKIEEDLHIQEFPILLKNKLLVDNGFNEVFDITEKSLKDHKACVEGCDFAKHMFSILDTNIITWDLAVDYLRENPEKYTEKVTDYLSWWWDLSQ